MTIMSNGNAVASTSSKEEFSFLEDNEPEVSIFLCSPLTVMIAGASICNNEGVQP